MTNTRQIVTQIMTRRNPSSLSPSSSSLSTNNSTRKVVEGVWLFHRHGDRTPNRTLCAEHMMERESTFWRSKIPPTNNNEQGGDSYRDLEERYPLHSMRTKENGEKEDFVDISSEPFGFLTYKGMDQMKTVGKNLGLKYHRCGGKEGSFLDQWDVRAYSTNYLRTVMSVRCFLDGLLDASSSSSITIKDDYMAQKIPVTIRDKESDILNAYDQNPSLMRELTKSVVSSPNFRERDAKAAPLATRLANYLPGLKSIPKIFGGSPSGINWVHATDHFVCRSAHGLPFDAFLGYEEDGDEMESTLAAMASPTEAHLTWRFRQYYQNRPLLSAVATPALREIEQQIQEVSSSCLESKQRRPFTVYSCHDVTILGLLYAIGADFLVNSGAADSSPKNWGRWRWWPDYASTLVFELIRQETPENELGSHAIRVFLDGNPLNMVVDAATTDITDGQQGVKSVLKLSDFSRIVQQLEEDGKIPDCADANKDSSPEKDRNMEFRTG